MSPPTLRPTAGQSNQTTTSKEDDMTKQQQLQEIAQELLDFHHPALLKLAEENKKFSALLWKAKKILAEIERSEQ
jgi:hypothetical protein